ncbi:fasciclin domain-containing protein [Flavobacterium orientale]|uniref:Beta-Ig-H3/fasciclin domain-containing protein n=1 Tax=Flavobacterium orientale TaxID=1756020 RepID=A0A916XZW7_9FLAO|nr:fasciclin domain-containing protein [Flavobacterium orientale]GGD24588.1 beta-Ig-H3/fasciclin domain-containing protein [Flavobacterium orientale]
MKTNPFNLRKRVVSLAFLTAMATAVLSCDSDESVNFDSESSKLTLVETLENINNTANRAPAPGTTPIAGIAVGAEFTELVGALVYVDQELDAGLVNLFSNGTNQHTVFAPTDEAFDALYTELGVDGITDLPAELVLDVLKYHVVEGRRAANSVVPPVKSRTITTLLGATFAVNKDALLTAVGSTATITTANISASNGIIHVIDQVLLPIVPGSDKPANAPGSDSIATIAVNANFTELVAALTYVDQELNAGLVTLFANGTDQYTVFAPTNQAFENLYTDLNIDGITDLPATLVLDVLKYHVVEGRRAANSVVPRVNSRTINTLLGVSFSVNNQAVITAVGNTSSIVIPNISASNGIIHVIDTVLLPIQ